MKAPFNPAVWISRFRKNRERRTEPAWDLPLNVPSGALEAVIRSVREFQLGDGGGPAALIAWNARSFREQSPAMKEVVDLWFAEEREHSRLLGRALERLGGAPVTTHWSFRLFCRVRKYGGVSFELQALTLTELVSTAYYRELRRLCPDIPVRQMCSLILRDEAGHVAFHNDRLAADGRSPLGIAGSMWALQFWLSGLAAATVLWSSHGRCLRALGGSREAFFAEVRYQIGLFLTRLAMKGVAAAERPVQAVSAPAG
jgi:hypothetical protein